MPESRADASSSQQSLFLRATIFRPISLLMLFVAFLVVGLIAYPKIPMQLVPDGLSFGSCTIFIPVPDATPREVMEEIAKPCEDVLRVIPGIRRISSGSRSSACRIWLETSPSVDMQVLVADVRDRLERAKAFWPEGVDRYTIWRQNESEMPVLISALSMDVDEDTVDVDYLFDEVVRRRLESVDGVASVTIWGLLAKHVEIGLNVDRVDAHNVPLNEVIQRISADHQTVGIGRVHDDDAELFVVAEGKFRDFDEVLEYPTGDGLRVKDFADVDYQHSVQEFLSRLNGKPTRVIAVKKASAANTVEVCARLQTSLRALESELRGQVPTLTRVEALTWLNQGEMIHLSVKSLRDTGLWGGVFAVVVLFLFFRRVGMTLLVTLAIPFSLLITVIWLYLRGGSFNILSLMGLSLGVGMLVDNSIVVVENILRQREKGLAPRAAAIAGLREVGLAVTLATLTTVMVFLPVIFVADPAFQVIAVELGLPVCVSVLASLLVALVFIPQGSLYLDRYRSVSSARRASGEQFGRMNRSMRTLLAWCLEHRLETMILVVVLFFGVGKLAEKLPKATGDSEGRLQLRLSVRLPRNFSLREANETLSKIDNALIEHRQELGVRDVWSWFRSSGGTISLLLEPGPRVDEEEFFERVRGFLPKLAGVSYRMGDEDFHEDTEGHRLRVYVRGNDLDALNRLGVRVRAELEDSQRFPELVEIDEWRASEPAEVRVQVNRRLAQEYGIDTARVSRMVAWALRGAPLPDFELAQREMPFWIAYEGGAKERIEDLNRIQVFGTDGRSVPLENLADYDRVTGPGEIHRVNSVMTLGFSADVDGGDAERKAVRARIAEHFARFPVPRGLEVSLHESSTKVERDMENAGLAMGMGFCLVFFLMGILFESFILPLSVLFAVPFAFVGAVLLLWALQVSLDVVGMIGLLMLVGIVVNNAIVLVDYINRLRLTGAYRREAILRACQVRFRPIWMTALTTIFGLLPLLLFEQRGEGVNYKPLAVVLIGGLTTSTFFTLVVVPVLYTLVDDFRLRVRRVLTAPDHGALAREVLSRAPKTDSDAVDD
jgi:HAE1 family hydrophobic/amphiphilic exporter-1